MRRVLIMGYPEVVDRSSGESSPSRPGGRGDARDGLDPRLGAPPVPVVDAHGRRRRRAPRRRWRWLLVPLGAVVGLLVGLAWAAHTPPSYTAEATAFVGFAPPAGGDPNDQDPFGGSEFVLQRMATYAQLATSAEVLGGVSRDLNRGDVAELSRHVHAMAFPNTVMLRVTVDASQGKAAADIANSVMANLGRVVARLESGNGQAAASVNGQDPAVPNGQGPVSPVQLLQVQPASAPAKPSGDFAPLIGLLAGILVACGLVYVTRVRRRATTHQETAAPTVPQPRAAARQ